MNKILHSIAVIIGLDDAQDITIRALALVIQVTKTQDKNLQAQTF